MWLQLFYRLGVFIHFGMYGVMLWGLCTLCIGYAVVWPFGTLRGTRARLLGLLCLLPWPVTWAALNACVRVANTAGAQWTTDDLVALMLVVEGLATLSALVGTSLLARYWRERPALASPGDATGQTPPSSSGG